MKRLASSAAVLSCLIVSGAEAYPGGPTVEVLSIENRVTVGGDPYALVRAWMSGGVSHTDGSIGTYKVPLWLAYTEAPRRGCSTGVVEPAHFAGGFSFSGGLSDHADATAYEDIIDGMRSVLHGRGRKWMGVGNWKDLLEGARGTTFQGIYIDWSFHIPNGLDAWQILRDASLVERVPRRFFKKWPAWLGKGLPCAATEVIATGHSHTGWELRSFYQNGLNTSLATDPAFRRGLVFEGSIQMGEGPWCSDLDGGDLECPGALPLGQGKVIAMNSEADTLEGANLVRDVDGANPDYRSYEMAGTSHIPRWGLDAVSIGWRSLTDPMQNGADYRPVQRAMLENMRAWIGGVEPPDSVGLTGLVPATEGSDIGWPWAFLPPAELAPSFDSAEPDYDLNADGGIRLPHLRTELDSGEIVGGPLGIERGLSCLDLTPLDGPFACGWEDTTGDFIPYGALDRSVYPSIADRDPCEAYASHDDFTVAVRKAAEYAVAQRWVLAAEVEAIVAAAEARAALYPECVPP